MPNKDVNEALAQRFLDESKLLIGMALSLSRMVDSPQEGMDSAQKRKEIVSQFHALQEKLAVLFGMEEGEHGLFEDILALRPTEERRLDGLKEEHTALLTRCDSLSAKLDSPEESDFTEICTEVSSLLVSFRAHENREDKLIELIYFVDEGGG